MCEGVQRREHIVLMAHLHQPMHDALQEVNRVRRQGKPVWGSRVFSICNIFVVHL